MFSNKGNLSIANLNILKAYSTNNIRNKMKYSLRAANTSTDTLQQITKSGQLKILSYLLFSI